MRLELSRAAQADLTDIRDYSLDRFGPEKTLAYLDSIERAFRRIVQYPECGATRPSLHPALRSVTCQSHRIYYSVDHEVVRVVRILHMAMDAEQWLG